MNNRNLVIICVCVTIIALAIAASAYFQKGQPSEQYSVVYLTSGEVYVGKLSYFPTMTITDAYLIQIVKDETDAAKTSFQLSPLSKTIWSPEILRINQDQVIFSGPISETSQVMQTIKNGASAPK